MASRKAGKSEPELEGPLSKALRDLFGCAIDPRGSRLRSEATPASRTRAEEAQVSQQSLPDRNQRIPEKILEPLPGKFVLCESTPFKEAL